mgnify:CR=1 FL=1
MTEQGEQTITRIEFFGDSIIRGALWSDGKFRLRPGKDFPELAAMGFEVRNNGIIGSTIRKGAKVLERRLASLDEHTLVIMDFGGNDCDFDWKAVSAAPKDAHLPKVLLQEFASRYAKLIARVQATGAKVALCSLVPLDADKFFSFISKGNDPDRIMEWLGDKSILYRWHENYDRAVERLAAATGSALIDLRDGFLTRHDFSGLIGPDGIHPTEAGYRIIDEIIAGEVEELTAAPAMA